MPKAELKHLDAEAIKKARDKYKEKINDEIKATEIDAMTDLEFLTKIKLIIDGKITSAAMLLLGKAEHDNLFDYAPEIMWCLYDSHGDQRDYAIFKIPFLDVVDKVFDKIRNLNYRYMIDQNSLFPREVQQYDPWLLRELLNNCIVHSNYNLGQRIYVNECEDSICVTNAGVFLPGNVEKVLRKSYHPPFYLNQLLAEAMVNFKMIDTASMGIRKVFRIQQRRFFPMPDYDIGENEVAVTVYGKILNQKYTYLLFNHPELDLDSIYALDQVQKGQGRKLNDEIIAYLRTNKLIEGRKTSMYLSAEVANIMGDKEQYIKNKGFDDKYYKDMIIDYLQEYQRASRRDFERLLISKLPENLTLQQKKNKITTVLTALRRKGIIISVGTNKQNAKWELGDDEG